MFEFLLCVGYMHASTVRWTHGHYQFSTSRGRPTGAPLLQVAYSDPASGVYLGSPSIARLDAHTLLISHVSGLSPFIFLSSATKRFRLTCAAWHQDGYQRRLLARRRHCACVLCSALGALVARPTPVGLSWLIVFPEPSRGGPNWLPTCPPGAPHAGPAVQDTFPEWGRPKATTVWASDDGGASWQRRAVVPRQYWSSLFVHRGAHGCLLLAVCASHILCKAG